MWAAGVGNGFQRSLVQPLFHQEDALWLQQSRWEGPYFLSAELDTGEPPAAGGARRTRSLYDPTGAERGTHRLGGLRQGSQKPQADRERPTENLVVKVIMSSDQGQGEALLMSCLWQWSSWAPHTDRSEQRRRLLPCNGLTGCRRALFGLGDLPTTPWSESLCLLLQLTSCHCTPHSFVSATLDV